MGYAVGAVAVPLVEYILSQSASLSFGLHEDVRRFLEKTPNTMVHTSPPTTAAPNRPRPLAVAKSHAVEATFPPTVDAALSKGSAPPEKSKTTP